MVKVFICILNWNRPKDTLECLGSVSELSHADFALSVVVVDNGSTDDSVEQIKKFKPKDLNLKLIQNRKNLGYAQGNNVGIKYALKQGADWVLVLNNDTLVDKNLVKEMVTAATGRPRVGAVTPKIYFAKGFEFHKEKYKDEQRGKVIWSAGGKIDWGNVYGLNRGVDEVDRGQYSRTETVDFATGTAMLLSAEALKRVGLFDTKYYMYLEDVDLSYRMKKEGWNILYEPKAVLWHKVSQSSGIGTDLNDYFITRNRMLFGITHASFRSKTALIRESIRFLFTGRSWQRTGILDFYLGRFGRGSWPRDRKAPGLEGK